jgi:hypothetical protein
MDGPSQQAAGTSGAPGEMPMPSRDGGEKLLIIEENEKILVGDISKPDEEFQGREPRAEKTATVIFVGSGSALSAMTELKRDGKIRMADASSTSIGSSLSTSVTSLNDTAAISCAFTTDSTTASGVQITTSSGSCTNRFACIVCTPATSGANCSINCSGTVPSSAAEATDSFNVFFTVTSTLTTNMSGTPAAGMIRVDGKLSNWAEFNFSNQSNAPTFSTLATNYANCTGANSHMSVYSGTGSLSDAIAGTAQTTASSFAQDPSIISFGNGNCGLSFQFKANMSLAGANVPGAVINLSRGTITVATTICDSTLSCPAPI